MKSYIQIIYKFACYHISIDDDYSYKKTMELLKYIDEIEASPSES
jgi:hypothetical protein